MATGFQRVLARYGQTVEVFPNGEEPGLLATALLQPIRDRERQVVAGHLGWERKERWLYLGEPEVSLDIGEKGFLKAGESTFEVYSARRVDLGKETCHWWAILLPREEEA